MSLIVHRRGSFGIIFAVLLVTGGSEQVALDWLVLKFLSISECKDPRRTELSSRPDIDSASSRAYVSRPSAFGHPDLCAEARLDPMLMSWTKIILFLCSRPEPVLSIQLFAIFLFLEVDLTCAFMVPPLSICRPKLLDLQLDCGPEDRDCCWILFDLVVLDKRILCLLGFVLTLHFFTRVFEVNSSFRGATMNCLHASRRHKPLVTTPVSRLSDFFFGIVKNVNTRDYGLLSVWGFLYASLTYYVF